MSLLGTRKKTPLWDAHRQLGAKLIDFGGWDMPVSYPAGTIKEHRAMREAVGLFDVSHMGEAYLRGPRAREVVAKLCSNACERNHSTSFGVFDALTITMKSSSARL